MTAAFAVQRVLRPAWRTCGAVRPGRELSAKGAAALAGCWELNGREQRGDGARGRGAASPKQRARGRGRRGGHRPDRGARTGLSKTARILILILSRAMTCVLRRDRRHLAILGVPATGAFRSVSRGEVRGLNLESLPSRLNVQHLSSAARLRVRELTCTHSPRATKVTTGYRVAQ